MARIYLWICCMSGEVTDNSFIIANEVKQKQASKSIITPSKLWLHHKKLRIKIKQFADAPMHMLFLEVTKHSLAHVVCLFGKQKFELSTLCGVISEHIKHGKDISLDWCPITDFAEAESISTSCLQSAQYVAFSCLSLVYLD
jgi:hypothetical protein